MNTDKHNGFGPRFMLAMALAAFATFADAQEAAQAVDELEPAIDTSLDFEPAVDTSAVLPAEDAAAPVLAAGVTRDETSGQVMDSMELGRTEITGNQELPKVLYIVPWQKADPGDLTGRPVNSLLDEVLAPVDRDEFIRQVEYYNDLYGNSEEAE